MKKIRLTSLMSRIFIILFVCCINAGCEKNELSLQGNLYTTFYNHDSNVNVTIYSLQDKETPLYQVTAKSNGTLEIPLNVGDYIMKPSSTPEYFPPIGFQIMQNKTTTVIYDKNDQGKVSVN